jgi:hypothetical protein
VAVDRLQGKAYGRFMSGRVRSTIGVVAFVALAACGSEPAPGAAPAAQPVDSLPAVATTAPDGVAPTTTSVPTTVAANETVTTIGEPVVTEPDGEPVWIELDRYQIKAVVPADAGPDPMGEFEPPDFVVDSRRWMTDCCWLMLTVQTERPLHPDEQLVGTVDANGLEWELYDTGEEGFLQIAVTTVDDLSISIATQQRFEGDESKPAATDTVRAMVDTLEVRER